MSRDAREVREPSSCKRGATSCNVEEKGGEMKPRNSLTTRWSFASERVGQSRNTSPRASRWLTERISESSVQPSGGDWIKLAVIHLGRDGCRSRRSGHDKDVLWCVPPFNVVSQSPVQANERDLPNMQLGQRDSVRSWSSRRATRRHFG